MTPVRAEQRDRHGGETGYVVTAHTNLSDVERDFRSIKVDDLDLRPIHHRLEDRVRAHVLICMLAAYPVWHYAAARGQRRGVPAPRAGDRRAPRRRSLSSGPLNADDYRDLIA